jgi:hypothetical protein
MLIFANKKNSKRRKEKSMATMATTPMAEITLHINDISLLNDIKRAVKMIRGVDSITVKKAKELTSYERSKADIKAGRVYSYDKLDDLIKEIGV